jgi:hypothetical protein
LKSIGMADSFHQNQTSPTARKRKSMSEIPEHTAGVEFIILSVLTDKEHTAFSARWRNLMP